ncbi:MAG TPA: replicative DNA helicase [Candidatus Acidoferrales bacterium]|nr:replicative DNA helicase [Candidatus Acidoferrales bacterium]
MNSDIGIERPLPYSEAAERGVLGAILIGNPEGRAIVDRLAQDDFFLSQHREIFAAVLRLAEGQTPIDLLSVHEALLQSDRLDAAGGIGYVAQLGDGTPRVSSLEYYAQTIKAKAARRTFIKATLALYEAGFDTAQSEESLLDRSIEKLSEIARTLEADRDTGITYRAAAADLLQEFDSQEGVRIFTDIDELDRLTGGFRAGELVLFTAETGVGKTLLAQQTRRRSCRDSRHTLFCSGEMRARHLVSRELATEAGVEHWKMRRPERITPEETSALLAAASHECSQCRILDGELSMARIRKVARQMKSRSDVDLIIVDYDELVEAPGKDEFEQQRYIVRAGKSLAMELKCPVIVISQLRKSLQGEDRKKPTLQRLYGSGAKAKHSSIVVYVDRPYVQELSGDETEARIVIAKNRDGKVGAIDARFNVKTLRFESLPAEVTHQAVPHWTEREGEN